MTEAPSKAQPSNVSSIELMKLPHNQEPDYFINIIFRTWMFLPACNL